jgi:hypothetical protein
MTGDRLPLAVRAYARPQTAKDAQPDNRPDSQRIDPARRPPAILVLDCETTIGPEQALLFGCYRYYRLTWHQNGPELTCMAEGFFHADDLAHRDALGYRRLREYTRRNGASVASVPGAARRLKLQQRGQFVQRVLLRALDAGATVVLFNAPFDLSRLMLGWGEARARGFEGGFSFWSAEYERDGGRVENRFRPRFLMRSFDSRRARLGLTHPRPGSDPDAAAHGRGDFLDLRTLAYALSGESHNLESACQAFGISFQKSPVVHGEIKSGNLEYCRADVAATAALYRALACEYEQWGLQLAPTRAYSPASLAKAQLREAGIRPALARQPDFSKEALGYSLVAYYGGRAECRVRRVPVPVVYLDFASMYPTASALLGLWRFHTCKRIDVVEEKDPAKVERWLARLTLDACLQPGLWPELCGFALVQPDDDVLPVRARYSRGGSYGIGVNPLTSREPLWYTLLDLLASRLITGRTPRILRAFRIRPTGRQRGLKPLRIRGSRPIDPVHEDVFRAQVEERRRLEQLADPESRRTAAALKRDANSACYGITVELNRQPAHADPVPVTVYGLDRFNSQAPASEEPGEYFFPPLASLVTGAARLMLTLLERFVSDAGGFWAFADTDSAGVVATEHGDLVPCPGGPERDDAGRECVRALAWADLDRIIARFQPLNPYDPALIPSILRLEPENFDPDTDAHRELHCYAISAKRYCLYVLDAQGEPELVKWSEHALGGFYLNPLDPERDERDWVHEAWQ